MLHKETISPFLEKCLKELMLIGELKDYVLVGGTGLSLQLGHRKSFDIDIFRPDYKSGDEMLPILRKYYPHVNISSLSFGLSMYLPEPGSNKTLKVDIMSNEPFIRPYFTYNGIRIAHIEDIAAMKFEAITSRLEKKDFCDIAEIMSKYTFKQIAGFYKERYPWNDLKDVVFRMSLVDQCDGQPDPEYLNGKTWDDIKSRINKSLDQYLSDSINNGSIGKIKNIEEKPKE